MRDEIQDAERLFGELAVKLYFASRKDVDRALKAQREARAAGGEPAIGEVMVALDILTQERVDVILKAQEIYDENSVETLYGRLAIKNGFITKSDLEVALKVQQRVGGRLRIGEVLVKKSFVTWEQHEALLRAQERLLAGVEAKKAASGRQERVEDETAEAEPNDSGKRERSDGAKPKVQLRPPGQ